MFQADIVFEFIASSVQQKFWSKITGLKMFSSIDGAPSSHHSKVRITVLSCTIQLLVEY